MTREPVSRRGVYYDLDMSPYEYCTPYGDIFKFSSKKKMEMYTRDIVKEISRMEKALSRNQLDCLLPDEIVVLVYRLVYHSFYNKIEG